MWVGNSQQISVSKVVADCSSVTSKQNCYINRITGVVESRGLNDALDLLAGIYKADPDFGQYCHFVSHALGQSAYAVFHKGGDLKLNDKTSYCGYGFYHGFMEALFATTHDFDEARAFCHYAGTVVPLPVGYAEGACYHGIGHGVTDGYDSSLWGDPAKMAAPGLTLCQNVATSSTWRYRCDSGVFNSIAILFHDPKYKLNTNGNPFTLCDTASYDTEARESCFDQMNTFAVYLAGGDLKRAIRFTTNIDDPHDRDIAIRGITSYYIQDLKQRNQQLDLVTVVNVCGSLPVALSETCIKGIVDGTGEFGTPGAQYADMKEICDNSDLADNFKQICYNEIVSLAQMSYIHENPGSVCLEIPDKYRAGACSFLSS